MVSDDRPSSHGPDGCASDVTFRSSEASLVRIPAILRGSHGNVGKCLLDCWTEKSSAGKTYTRCRITDDPPELPDGEYLLQLPNEKAIRTNKHRGMWALGFLAPEFHKLEL
jgi:hypothetical protein